MATTLAVVIKPGGAARGPLFSSVAHGVQSEKGSLGGCWSGLAAEGTSSDRRPQARSDGERSRRCWGFGGEVSRTDHPDFRRGIHARLIDVGSRRLCGHYDIRIRDPALPDIINCSTTHHSPSNPGKSKPPRGFRSSPLDKTFRRSRSRSTSIRVQPVSVESVCSRRATPG